MNLKEAMILSLKKPEVFSKVSDFLRFHMNLNYDQSRDYYIKHTGIDAEEYEQLCYEADYYDSATN